MVEQLQAGSCFINNYNVTPVELPFGGYKMSGRSPDALQYNEACVHLLRELHTYYVILFTYQNKYNVQFRRCDILVVLHPNGGRFM